MIEVEGLRKSYGDFAAVVDSTFSVAPGEVFGLVGPNGAGKTTTLKMLAGLVEPTAGSATVAGYDAGDPEMRHRLGYLPEESPLYEEMTAESYLSFFADLYDVPPEVADERIDETLTRLDLEYRDRKLGDVSKGMKRKVAIARSLVNDPDVVIYDEPASGLDPLTTDMVLEFTRELKQAEKTVVFSAHNLYHVESVCDRVAIMNEGRIIARGSVESIRREHGSRQYLVTTDVRIDPETIDADVRLDRDSTAGEEADPEGIRSEGGAGYRYVAEDLAAVDRLREALAAEGGQVIDLRTDESTLEEIFLELTGEPMAGPRTATPGEQT